MTVVFEINEYLSIFTQIQKISFKCIYIFEKNRLQIAPFSQNKEEILSFFFLTNN